jgi:hypothetical protein
VKFPATKKQLLEENKKLNARSEAIKTLEACPDREYNKFLMSSRNAEANRIGKSNKLTTLGLTWLN